MARTAGREGTSDDARASFVAEGLRRGQSLGLRGGVLHTRARAQHATYAITFVRLG